jgi:hypothetical protein
MILFKKNTVYLKNKNMQTITLVILCSLVAALCVIAVYYRQKSIALRDVVIILCEQPDNFSLIKDILFGSNWKESFTLAEKQWQFIVTNGFKPIVITEMTEKISCYFTDMISGGIDAYQIMLFLNMVKELSFKKGELYAIPITAVKKILKDHKIVRVLESNIMEQIQSKTNGEKIVFISKLFFKKNGAYVFIGEGFESGFFKVLKKDIFRTIDLQTLNQDYTSFTKEQKSAVELLTGHFKNLRAHHDAKNIQWRTVIDVLTMIKEPVLPRQHLAVVA